MTMIDQISTLGVRFLAIYILTQGFSGIATMLASISVNDSIDYGWFPLFVLVGPVTTGILLWLLSKPLGKLVGKGLKSETPTLSEVGILASGTALIGIFIAITAIPDLTRSLISLSDLERLGTFTKTDLYADVYSAVLQGALGVLLIVGKERIGKLLRVVRYGGTSA